jgi:hypothetical protein
VVLLPLAGLPHAPHWTGAAIGISISPVQRIWRVPGRQPHRVCQFKLSKESVVRPGPADEAVFWMLRHG